MISYIKGKLAEVQAGAVVLDVGGIGYRVQVPLSVLNKLPARGEDVLLYTHLAVREEGFFLYGFSDQNELGFFLKLLGVSGIGPKVALAILTIFSPDELGRIIIGGDTAALTRVPGVGKKTAGRIILELKDKVTETTLEREPLSGRSGVEADAVEALEALGYTAAEALKAVKEVLKGPGQPSAAEIVREALRLLVKR
ncbi:MAG: Holliday junction branch migration protein RuvA [Pelotomaculum sp.]|nr:Holliday junction branch migration protein RuvA [Pelotomaculum sp.]